MGNQLILESIQNRTITLLQDTILPFWMEYSLDIRGGFFGFINNQNQVDPTAPKGLVMISRFLWSFSALYRLTGNEEHKNFADHSYDFLTRNMKDPDHGGYAWFTDDLGTISENRKQLYGLAFAMYGLSEYAKINPDPGIISQAQDVFHFIEQYGKDELHRGYWEACTPDWNVIPSSSLSNADIPCSKSMNTHLHILEGFTNLYRVAPHTENLKASMRELIDIHFDKIVDPKTFHLNLYFDRDWTVLDGPVSYGHDIEASWLLWEAIQELKDEELEKKFRNKGIQLFETSLEGFFTLENQDLGYLANEKHANLIDKTRIWWVEAEALVGLFNGWELTENDKYLHLLNQVLGYIEKYQVCPQGDWYWAIDEHNKPDLDKPKAGSWKTPYHTSRACIELINRIEDILQNEQE